MAARGAEPRPARGWLWISVAGVGALALLAGMVLRAGGRGGGPEVLMVGSLAALAAAALAAEVIAVLQAVQAREVAAAALRGLPAGFRVSGRVRVRGRGRPAVVDHIVVAPDGTAWAVTVDGSTRPPRPGDATEGLGPLLAAARRAAALVEEAAAAGVLPPELGLRRGMRVRPCILVARRPLRAGRSGDVWAFPAGDAVRVLAGAEDRPSG